MKSRTLTSPGFLLPLALLSACGGSDDGQSLAGVGIGTGGVTTIPVGGGGASASGGSVGAPGGGGAVVTGTGGVVLGTGGSISPSGGAGSGTGGVSTSTGGAAVGGAPGTGGMAAIGGSGPGPSGTDYTFVTAKVSVPAGGEVYKCQDFTNPFNKDIGIVRMDTALTPGSHHMFAFVMPNSQMTLKDSLVDCPSGGVEFHDYLTTTGSPQTTTTYKPGIGRVFSASNGLRLNVHLINTGLDPKDAYISFKVTFVDPSTLDQKVASIFLNQVGLSVPNGMSTQSKTYTLSQDINLMDDASHMHKRGIHFVAKTNTGQSLYDGTDWQEPKPQVFDPPLLLKSGTQITWACTYNNDSGGPLSFGESASANEMCIFPGEFYNKTGTQISYQAIF